MFFTLSKELNYIKGEVVKWTNQMEVINRKKAFLEQTLNQQYPKIQELEEQLKEFNDLNKKMISSVKTIIEELNDLKFGTHYVYVNNKQKIMKIPKRYWL